MTPGLALLALSLPAALPPIAATQDAAEEERGEELVARDWLVLEAVDRRGRRPFARDAVFARYLLDAGAPPPGEGEEIEGELGEARAWSRREAGERGELEGEEIAWAYARLEREDGAVWIADLRGAHTLYVNGDAFAGDLYGYGSGGVPIELRAGRNELFVTGIRGAPRLVLRRPSAPCFVTDRDATLPDLLKGETGSAPVGLLALNASTVERRAGDWSVRLASGEWSSETRFPFPLAPLGIAKLPLEGRFEAGEERAEIVATAHAGGVEAPARFELRRRGDEAVRVETFVSAIDRSVQEFAVRPAEDDGPCGLVLSLHGAGVGCRGQARSYGRLADLWLVAPTNRRPFGFDWQDWGRADAYEVLDRALALTGADPDRVYLTGHSMGGHGTWNIASNDPDRFAAIAPSAGWESFDSYGGRPVDRLADVWQDADAPSRTLARVENLVQLPTFVLHGEADDNVPASEARAMIAALEAAGGKPRSHFEPGKGHWWDGDAAPGADCVSWPGIFELFAESRRPKDPTSIAFVSADPSVDARHFWLRVDQAIAYGVPVRMRGELDAEARELRVTTENARRIAIEPPASFEFDRFVVDGFRFEREGGAADLELLREDGFWRVAMPLGAREKSPARSGPFKRAFDRGFLLVYGTAGSEEESNELLARARFDAETWWYRGNGLAWVVSDAELAALDAAGELGERNLVLYGNEDTNRAFASWLPEACPVRARRGSIAIGNRIWRGESLACLFVQPRRDSDDALVGAFADSGSRGSRLGYTFETFVSGAGFPDLALVDERVLTEGDAAVLCAGWFDANWRWVRGRVERGGEPLDSAR